MNWLQQPTSSPLVGLIGVLFIITGCTSVDTVRLTSKTFSPKSSPQEVQIIDRTPPCKHIRLAQLSVEDDTSSYDTQQAAILKKAAKLGADAVVFHKGTQRVKTSPAYGGYGGAYRYPGWGYGPYGVGGYQER